MIGKRYPDGEWIEEPGGYSKHVLEGVVAWTLRCPNGGANFMIGSPNADGTPHHFVEENEDGTITVRPHPPGDPSNSNSILFNGWHGYIYAGEWREL